MIYAKLKTRSKEYYSFKKKKMIFEKCREILDEVEKRRIATLHHETFSDEVTKRVMVTKIINDSNIMTVNRLHVYRLMDENEERCGIGS